VARSVRCRASASRRPPTRTGSRRSAAALAQDAADAEISRLYDGTHYEHDIAAGTAVGQSMAQLFIARARNDGARPPR
jgi:hypothetical protein